MKIRHNHPILDRVKVIIVLFCLLIVLGNIVCLMERKNDKQKTSTVKEFLEISLKPIGTTMYIWGGGWDAEDKTAGATSTQIGLYPQWSLFANQQDESYDYKNHKFERENGLDCSGYVGWVIYNAFETDSGKDGYVMTSTDMAKNFADRGWGEYIENPTNFLPGDIVSMDGHVWISLGTCEDGSVLLVHSSPPGVSVCGTIVEGEKESIASKLATEYMTNYHLNWQEKYPNRMVSDAYLDNVSLMRWNSSTMSDAEEFQSLRGEAIAEIMVSFQD